MADYQNVKVAIEDRVALVTIDHPPANALDSNTLKDLSAAVDDLLANDEAKAIVITGAGQMAFVAGADIGEFAKALQSGNADEMRAMLERGHATFLKIENSPKPVIAAINGVCLGGGLELALACHIRIAGDRARLGFSEINLGLMPGWGGTQRLPRVVGRGKALEIMLTGDMITAQDAKAAGLVQQVVPTADVVRQAVGLAKKIVAKSKLPAAGILEAVRASDHLGISEGLAFEAEQVSKVAVSEDFREGVTAFLQKRQPKFADK